MSNRLIYRIVMAGEWAGGTAASRSAASSAAASTTSAAGWACDPRSSADWLCILQTLDAARQRDL